MRLLSVTIENFRGYSTAQTVAFEDLTTIIGRNDVGKSTILEALEIFFNNDVVKIETSDCNIHAVDKVVAISCTFGDLPDSIVLDATASTSLAEEFLVATDGTLTIKKTFNCSLAKPKEEVFVVSEHPTAPEYSDLLSLTNAELKKRYKALAIHDASVNLSVNPSMRKAIWASCEDLQLAATNVPVGAGEAKKIWERIIPHMPMYALFQSDRASTDADSEVQNPMKLAVSAALAEKEIQKKLDEVVEAVRMHATELAIRTHASLMKLDAALASQLVPKFKSDPKWNSLFSITLDGDDGIPINKRGSGVRRLVLVSFFRAEAERKLAEGSKQNIIYAVEEPETSQHPRNQKILLDSFKTLAEADGCQVILTTHSPGLACDLEVGGLRFVSKRQGSIPTVAGPNESTWEQITEELGVVPDNRVKVLICVEGPTDVEALRHLSHALHVDDTSVLDLSTDARIAFVVLGGGSLKHWVNNHYLRGLGRPEVHIYDRDVPTYAEFVTEVNSRSDGSWGVLTLKREIENYAHPDAISEGLGISLEYGDDDDVPELIKSELTWNANTAKRRMASQVFPLMTAERINEIDPDGELLDFLRRVEKTFS